MKRARRLISILLTIAVMATMGIAIVSGVVEPVPSLTISFDTAADMKYFSLPTDNLGTWVIEDGILKQTVPVILDTNGWPVQPILDTKQAITLKDQMLKDYEIEFDFITATHAEISDIMNPSVSARMMLLATNVPDGSKFAVSQTNGGYGFAHTDPKAWGGTTKRISIADLGLDTSGQLANTSPAWNPNDASAVPYLLGSSPNAVTNIKYKPYEPAGIHTFKIVKVGDSIKYYYKNQLTDTDPNDPTYNTGYSTYTGNLATYYRADYELVYEITNSKYDVAGAVQFIAGGGVLRLDNIKITSADLNLNAYVTPTPIPTATPTPAPLPSVVIPFNTAADMKYFSLPTDNLGTWVIEDGILKQTVPVILDTNGWPVQPILDTKQAITLKDQMLKDYEIEFDFITATHAEISDIMTPSVSARMMLLATNVPDGSKFAVSQTNGGYGFAHTDPKAWGGTTKRISIADLGLDTSGQLANTSPAWNPNDASAVPYLLGSSPNAVTNIKYKPYEPAGIHTFKIVKVGDSIKYYYKNQLTDTDPNDPTYNTGYSTTYLGNLATYYRADYELVYEITNSKYDVAGAVQFIAGGGVLRLDNIKITSADLNLSAFADPTPTTAPTTEATPTTAPTTEATPTTAPTTEPTVAPTSGPTATPTEAEVFPADLVVAQIDLIPATVTLADKALILEARAAYEALSEEEKSLVTNLYQLLIAEEQLAAIDTSEVSESDDSPDTSDSSATYFYIVLAAVAASMLVYRSKQVKVQQ